MSQFHDFFSVLILIILIVGLISIAGARHYKPDSAYLRIKSSKRYLAGQELLILCGSVCCCIIIPLLFIVSSNKTVIVRLLDNIFSDPILIVCFLSMLLCPIGIVIVSIYMLISNLAKSTKPNFIKEIVLDDKYNCIKVYSNTDIKTVPFDNVISFNVHITTTAVPNISTGAIKAGLSIGNKLCNDGIAGLIAGAATGSGNTEVITDIEITISTKNYGKFEINTLGNTLLDSNSQKLLGALIKYKTKINGFYINIF